MAIARAVAGQAAVVLADEPTGNLDTATGAGIIALLTRMAERRHGRGGDDPRPGVAAAMERRVEMRDGRIVALTGP